MPKKLVGGVFLLCLTAMTLTLSEDGETFTNITQPEILEQLTNLKTYVSNPSMIKPVWVQLMNGDEIVVVQGELKVVDTGKFEICVQLNGYKLVISIEFTQATLDDNTPIDDWYIDENDAKYLFTTDAQSIGAISELPIFENIVDAQGNKRFIEGDIEIETKEGLSKDFGKWALSGSHLLIVLAFTIQSNITIGVEKLGELKNLPDWVKGKIIPLFSRYVFANSVNGFTDAFGVLQGGFSLYKQDSGEIEIRSYNSITSNAITHFRVAFDLLIDNETPTSQGE